MASKLERLIIVKMSNEQHDFVLHQTRKEWGCSVGHYFGMMIKDATVNGEIVDLPEVETKVNNRKKPVNLLPGKDTFKAITKYANIHNLERDEVVRRIVAKAMSA